MTRTVQVGETRSCEVHVTEAMVTAFATLSGDVNPLHVDARFAQTQGFPRPVAHGMLSLAAISRLIGTELPGPGAMWISQQVQFQRPVFVGDTITASVTVERVSAAVGIIELRTDGRITKTGEPVLSGQAKVRLTGAEAVEDGGREPATAPRAVVTRATSRRVALVTGSSRGMGRAIARALAADGIEVAVHFVDRDAEAAATVEGITRDGGIAHACRANLADAGGADRLVDLALERFGRIDILVNNATPPIVMKPVLECSWDDVQAYLDLYVRAALRLTQRVLPGMQERKHGRIVNILSLYAFGVPPPRLGAYVTAKAALAGLSRALAVELGPLGITVNMLAPSTVITGQTEAMSMRSRQLQAAQTPLRRMATADDVAGATRFLVGDDAGFITGAVLPVAGGTIMS